MPFCNHREHIPSYDDWLASQMETQLADESNEYDWTDADNDAETTERMSNWGSDE